MFLLSASPVPLLAKRGELFLSTVIAGLDPAIHVNKFTLLLIWIPGSKPGDDDKKIKCPGMTCTAGARRVDNIVPQRPRCSIVFHGQDCALKCGSPGRGPGMTR